MVHFREDCANLLELLLIYVPIVVLIMLDALTLEDPLLVGACSLVLHSFYGRARNKIRFLNHLLNMNTRLCPKPVQKYSSYRGCLLSWVFARTHLLLSMGIIPVQYTLLLILFFMRTKHIEDRVISLPHVTSTLQVVDIFTKTLTGQRHQFLVDKLMLLDKPTSI